MPEKTIRVRVTALPERGFYRAGKFWPNGKSEPTEVTPAELDALQREKKLAVEVLDDEKPKADEKPKK